MSYRSQTTIICDGGGRLLCLGKVQGAGDVKTLRAAAKAAGWQHTKKGRDLCPKHRTDGGPK